MRLPRNLSGDQLAKALGAFGYVATRQSGSHVRLTTQQNGEHHLTLPMHAPLKVGTLSAILKQVAAHFEVTVDEVLTRSGL